MPTESVPEIADVLKDITKKYKVRIGAAADVVDSVTSLTTGNIAIDHLTGVGGIPLARITELYGLPSSGKTTTALQTAAAYQRRIIADSLDEYILYLDFEQALDRDYCAALGLDIDHPSFIGVQPVWLEDGADIAEQIMRTGKVRLSIWDSVARMTPREVDFGIRTAAMERARLMSSLLQRQVSLLHAHNCAGVFVNHLTEAISMGPTRPGMPPAETSPGGKALKFYASLRMAFKPTKPIKGKAYDALAGTDTEQVIGTNVKIRVTKNKIGVPSREAEVRVRFGQGFDNLWSAKEVLVAHGLVKLGASGMYYFDTLPDLAAGLDVTDKGRPHIRGEQALAIHADANPQWRAKFVALAARTIDAHGTGVTVAADDTGTDFAARPYVDMPADARDF